MPLLEFAFQNHVLRRYLSKMIDVTQESLMLLRDVPRHLPVRPNGKRLHISAVYRWTMRGVKGVRLETMKLGGSTYTSREALQRFSERLSISPEVRTLERPTSRARQRQLESANSAVMRELGL